MSDWLLAFREAWPPSPPGERPDDVPVSEREKEAADAIRHIGTNAIPHLLKWIQFARSADKSKIRGVVSRMPGAPDFWADGDRRFLLKGLVPSGFQALGSQAEGAIPELTKLLNHSSDVTTPHLAGMSLGAIGEKALPSLVSSLTNKADVTHSLIPYFIGIMGTNARPAVPALVKCLNSGNIALRDEASNILSSLDPEALKRATQP